MFGNCNHCCFCCGHPCTMLGVSLFISCKNKIQCVCVGKKKKFINPMKNSNKPLSVNINNNLIKNDYFSKQKNVRRVA